MTFLPVIAIALGSLQAVPTASRVENALNESDVASGADSPKTDYSGPDPRNQGTQIKGTQYVSIFIDFSLQRAQTEPEEVFVDLCVNACQGPPPSHAHHSDCNRLCDRPCTVDHTVTIKSTAEFEPANLTDLARLEGRMFQIANQRGFKISGDALSAYDDMLYTLSDLDDRFADQTLKITLPHMFNDPYQPCVYGSRTFYDREYSILADLKMTWIFEGNDAQGNHISFPVDLLTKTVPLGSVWILDEKPTTKTEVKCACETSDPLHEDGIGMIPQFYEGGRLKTFPLGFGKDFKSSDPKSLGISTGINLVGQNLNYTDFGITGTMSQGILTPGTVLWSSNPKVQDEAVILGAIRTTFSFDWSESDFDAPSAPLRTMCINMAKEQPDASTKFHVGGIHDFTLMRLCQQIANTRNRGPWDQAKLWIWTDNASYASIKEKLIPAPTPAQYREALYDILRTGQTTARQSQLVKLLQPSMLMSVGTNPNALVWAVQQSLRNDPKGTVSALSVPSGSIESQPDFGPEHVRTVVRALLTSRNEVAADAMTAFLLKGVPPTVRPKVKDSEELKALYMWTMMADSKRSAAAKSIIAEYGITAPE